MLKGVMSFDYDVFNVSKLDGIEYFGEVYDFFFDNFLLKGEINV